MLALSGFLKCEEPRVASLRRDLNRALGFGASLPMDAGPNGFYYPVRKTRVHF